MAGWMQDIRHAFRVLASKPGFTLLVVGVLAVGIGANSAIFSVVNAVLWQPLQYSESPRLVQIGRELPLGFSNAVSPAHFFYYRENNRSFTQIATYDGRGGGMNLTGGETPERVPSIRVSTEFFEVLRAQPQLGRSFTPKDGLRGGEKVAVISDGLWRRRFGSDPSIIGRSLRLSANSYTVIGVARPGFTFVNPADVWTPLILDPNDRSAVYYLVARLRPEVTIQAAQTDMERVVQQLRRNLPDVLQERERVVVRPLFDQVVGNIGTALLVLVGAVGFVLLIACANVANLLLARAAGRQKEIAVRAALGAGRLRILRQLLTECAVLALLGGALGLLLAYAGIDLLLFLKPGNLPRLEEIVVDRGVLGFTLAVSLVTGLLFGLFPALSATRLDPIEAIKEGGGRLTAGVSRRRARAALVISEIALACTLLVGAGLMIRSFIELRRLDPGFDARRILTMKMSLGGGQNLTTERFCTLTREMARRLTSLPGIEAAATISTLPLEHGLMNFFDIEGRPRDPKERTGRAQMRLISAGYFRVMGIPLLQGRTFTDSDTPDSPPVVIINSVLARQYFPGEDPVGKRLLTGGPGSSAPPVEIVGMVGDIRELAMDRPPTPTLFSPATQAADGLTTFLSNILPTCWVIRTAGEPLQYSEAARQEILSVDRDQPVAEVRSMQQVLSYSVARNQFNTILLSVFAGLALLLAAAGIYGVLSYSVAQRTAEIGLRVALGAGRRDALRLVLSQGLGLTAAGLVIGLVGGTLLTRFMSRLLFGVSPTDLVTFGVVTLLLIFVAAAACYLPARRAERVDPITALRHE